MISLNDYSDWYVLVKKTIAFVGTWATKVLRTTDRNNKQAMFKNCVWFIDL